MKRLQASSPTPKSTDIRRTLQKYWTPCRRDRHGESRATDRRGVALERAQAAARDSRAPEKLESVKDEVGTDAGRIETLEHPVVIERPGNQEELWAQIEGRNWKPV